MREPKCTHSRRGIVTSGAYTNGEPHAATNVCDRPDCIEDAKLWVNRIILARTAHYIPDRIAGSDGKDQLGIVHTGQVS